MLDAQGLAGLTSSDNKLHSLNDNSSEDAWWTISFDYDSSMTYAYILSSAHGNRAMRYNSGAPRFACYTSGQQPIAIYGYADSTSPTLKKYSFKCSLGVKPLDFTSDLHSRLRALYTQ